MDRMARQLKCDSSSKQPRCHRPPTARSEQQTLVTPSCRQNRVAGIFPRAITPRNPSVLHRRKELFCQRFHTSYENNNYASMSALIASVSLSLFLWVISVLAKGDVRSPPVRFLIEGKAAFIVEAGRRFLSPVFFLFSYRLERISAFSVFYSASEVAGLSTLSGNEWLRRLLSPVTWFMRGIHPLYREEGQWLFLLSVLTSPALIQLSSIHTWLLNNLTWR